MNQNVGSADRIARIVLGIAILVAGAALESWWGLVGLVPFATGLIGWCPAYLPFGISTCRLRAEGS